MTIFDQKYATESEDPTSPEHYLWISVLTKAAHDALYSSDWREAKIAIEWFKRKRPLLHANRQRHKTFENHQSSLMTSLF